MSRNLPEFLNLDHLKKQAKFLLRELRQRDPKAKLAQAQHEIARSYGFTSWAKLKAYVESHPAPLKPAHPAEVSVTPSSAPGGAFARYTEKARLTIFIARYLAGQGTRRIEAAHLLLGVIKADETLMNRLLRNQCSAEDLAKAIEQSIDVKQITSTKTDERISGECRRILNHAVEEADRLQHKNISTGHFLLGFLLEEGSARTPLTDLFRQKGILPDSVRNEIVCFLNEE